MIKRCSNGHWYDTTTNRTCPHCKRDGEKLSIRLNDVEEDDHTISIAEAGMSLGQELDAIIGNRGNSSLPRTQTEAMDDGDKTISFGFFGETIVQPVAGWLVCVSGSDKGRDYRLHSGKNFVGRGTQMDIILADDRQISRSKHCSFTYDPKGNAFYLSAEDGNLVYLNEEIVTQPQKLKESDQVTVGETTLMFVPFCKEGREWEKDLEN